MLHIIKEKGTRQHKNNFYFLISILKKKKNLANLDGLTFKDLKSLINQSEEAKKKKINITMISPSPHHVSIFKKLLHGYPTHPRCP